MVGCITSTNPKRLWLPPVEVEEPKQQPVQVDITHGPKGRLFCKYCKNSATHTAIDEDGTKVAFCSICVDPKVGLPGWSDIQVLPKKPGKSAKLIVRGDPSPRKKASRSKKTKNSEPSEPQLDD